MKQEATNSSTRPPSRERVWTMFDRFCSRYDFANRVISFGQDKSWRRAVARFAPKNNPLRVLDLATGTGDQLLALAEAGLHWQKATGMDMAEGMLALASKKPLPAALPTPEWITGDATQLENFSGQYDFVTMAYGIRNVTDVDQCLRGILSRLSPGGTCAILEASRPDNAFVCIGHRLFLRIWVQGIGGLISGDSRAFRYLPDTILTFPSGEEFLNRMRRAGFTNCRKKTLMLGAVAIYAGDKP